MNYYGKIISTAEARPYVVAERKFETKAEAEAYRMGVEDCVPQVDCENDDVSAMVDTVPSEDE
jgi:hypothetical protein